MFGRNTSAGTKTMAGGLLMTLIQTLITRRVAGRAAGLAVRGGGGIPGLLLWMAVSYLVNKYLKGNANRPTNGQSQQAYRRPQTTNAY